MLTTSSRLRIEKILKKLANGDEVSLQERIHINKYSARDQNVSSWLRKAIRLQQKKSCSNSIDQLLEDMNLFSSDPHSAYNPNLDDLGGWFSGAPSWIRRS